MKSLFNEYQDLNPEKFNKEFILQKKNDDILPYLKDISKAMEKTIEGIKFLGGEKITDESKFKKRPVQDINISRLDLINLKFKVSGYSNKNKCEMEEEIDLPIFFFKLIDDFHYIFNGNKYFPIYQLVDKDCYVIGTGKKKALVLKTLFMGITLRFENETVEDWNEELEVEGKKFIINIFNKKFNYLYYFFARYGIEKTLKFFKIKKKEIKIVKENMKEYETAVEENKLMFAVGKKIHVVLNKDSDILQTKRGRDFLVSFISLLKEKPFRYSSILIKDYWIKRLGENFTKNANNQLEKGKTVLISFERVFDEGTKKNLRIEKKDKKHIYGIVRWMINNFYHLITRDNMDVKNQRLRLSEYMINPILRKFSTNSYRMLNSKSSPTFEDKKSVLSNIPINFIIKKLLVSELFRYDNNVNGLELFSAALKCSKKGPQSIVSKNSDIAVKYRGIHKSYLGHFSLSYASAGDPGMTLTLSPFVHLPTLFFDDTIYKEVEQENIIIEDEHTEGEEVNVEEIESEE